MTKKHIVFIPCGVLPIPAVRGGAVENLVWQLADLNERHVGYEMTVYSPYDAKAVERSMVYKHTRFSFIRTSGLPNKMLTAFYRACGEWHSLFSGYDFRNLFLHHIIRDMKAHRQPDVVLLENAPRYAVEIRRFFPQAKVVLHYHNVPNEVSVWDTIDACTDCYFCISKFIKHEVERIFRLCGAGGDKARVFYNCLDIRRFCNVDGQERIKKRAELGIDEGDKVIVYTGRLQPYKGVRELLSGFSMMQMPRVKLLIVGGSFYECGTGNRFIRELKRIAGAFKDRVIFTGFVPYASIPAYYAAADVAVVPSIWDEPFALTALEALASGLPVVATKSGGIPEVVDERCAHLVERNEALPRSMAEALTEILCNDDLRKEMSETARKRAACFTTEIYWNRFTQLIRDL